MEANESNDASAHTEAEDMVAIMEGDRDVMEVAASRLEKAGIDSHIRIAGGGESIS